MVGFGSQGFRMLALDLPLLLSGYLVGLLPWGKADVGMSGVGGEAEVNGAGAGVR